jgi:hypothetical protein
MEAPAGEKTVGSSVQACYTDEQQSRLGVDENGEKKAADDAEDQVADEGAAAASNDGPEQGAGKHDDGDVEDVEGWCQHEVERALELPSGTFRATAGAWVSLDDESLKVEAIDFLGEESAGPFVDELIARKLARTLHRQEEQVRQEASLAREQELQRQSEAEDAEVLKVVAMAEAEEQARDNATRMVALSSESMEDININDEDDVDDESAGLTGVTSDEDAAARAASEKADARAAAEMEAEAKAAADALSLASLQEQEASARIQAQHVREAMQRKTEDERVQV